MNQISENRNHVIQVKNKTFVFKNQSKQNREITYCLIIFPLNVIIIIFVIVMTDLISVLFVIPMGGSFFQKLKSSTAGKIYRPIFSFFRKRVVNIEISELRLVSNSNERSGNFTFYRDIHKLLNSFIFEK